MPGTTNPNARFNADEIRQIRKLWRAGRVKAVDLADRFKVTERTILGIVHGETYKHVLQKTADTKQRLTKKGEKHNQHKLTNKQVREIKKLLCGRRGEQMELAERYSVHNSTISDIKTGKSWRHIK